MYSPKPMHRETPKTQHLLSGEYAQIMLENVNRS